MHNANPAGAAPREVTVSLLDRLRNFLGGDDPQRRPSFGSLDSQVARPSSPPTRQPEKPEDPEEAIEPTEEFELTLSLLREGAPFVLVTGQAGTGKTTCIRWLRSYHSCQRSSAVPTPMTG